MGDHAYLIDAYAVAVLLVLLLFIALGADFGYLTLLASLVHGILHAARYMYANMAYIMYETDAGRSGLVASFLLLPIVLPMKFEFFRNKVRPVADREEACLVPEVKQCGVVLCWRTTQMTGRSQYVNAKAARFHNHTSSLASPLFLPSTEIYIDL